MIMFAVVGSIFAVAGIVMLIQTNRYRALCTVESTGTVVRINERTTTKTNKKTHKKTKKTTYAPVVDYTFNSRDYTFSSKNYTSPSKYQTGQTVKIMVNSDQPDQIYIIGDNAEYVSGTMIAGMGGVFALIGIIGSVKMIRKKRMGLSY